MLSKVSATRHGAHHGALEKFAQACEDRYQTTTAERPRRSARVQCRCAKRGRGGARLANFDMSRWRKCGCLRRGDTPTEFSPASARRLPQSGGVCGDGRRKQGVKVRQRWLVAAAGLFVGAVLSPVLGSTATAQAEVCGSVGGVHVDVTGCSDPLYELNDALDYPPPPPRLHHRRPRHHPVRRPRRRLHRCTSPRRRLRRCTSRRRYPTSPSAPTSAAGSAWAAASRWTARRLTGCST